jgi:DNA-binding NtrC family response regulator
VGNRDPYRDEEAEDFGPLLSLLSTRSFAKVVLFCTGSSYIERARAVEEIAGRSDPGTTFNFVDISLSSPIDYQEIYSELKRSVDKVVQGLSHLPYKLSVLLDPGTPPMQTCWFLLVSSGYLPAELLQGVPGQYAGGSYRVRSVEIKDEAFPQVSIQDDAHATRAAGGPEQDGSGSPGRRRGRWIKSSATPVIGESPAFRGVLERVQRLAQYDVSVVIHGETGTGKEVVARLLHESSPRREKAFLAVNCAAISDSLAESELFGHKKGAFTGAATDRLGQFRAAHGGTLFLDEVGDLPLHIQPKLLRALEDGVITPVGGDAPVTADVRVLAATNQNIEQLIGEGRFRRDLYERLNQTGVALPPLRDRPEDIPVLTRRFVAAWNDRYNEKKGLAEETFAYFLEYPWPGNVRELQNTVTSLCATGQGADIGPGLLPRRILEYFDEHPRVGPVSVDIPEEGLDLRTFLTQVEREYYERALEKAEGNGERAAQLLGLKAPTFRKAARDRFNLTD